MQEMPRVRWGGIVLRRLAWACNQIHFGFYGAKESDMAQMQVLVGSYQICKPYG